MNEPTPTANPSTTTTTTDAAPDLATLQQQLAEARQTIAHLERCQQVDALLTEANVIDLEAARLLTEQAIAAMTEPDLAAAVADLQRHRPYLFRPAAPATAQAMGPRSEAVEPLDHAAASARATGHRRDLLAYLRLKRR